MKFLCLIIGLMLLSGCGQEKSPEVAGIEKNKYNFPALNESPLPPAPPLSEPLVAPSDDSPTSPPAEITEGFGQKAAVEKIEQLRLLREHAAQAGTNDPFALTEQQIEELSQLDNPIIN